MLCHPCPDTHLAACYFHNLSSLSPNLSCCPLSPKGVDVTLKRPGLLCLTMCVFVLVRCKCFPLLLFCQLMVTPTCSLLRRKAFTVLKKQAFCKPITTGRFQGFLLSMCHCNPFSGLFFTHCMLLLATHGGWGGATRRSDNHNAVEELASLCLIQLLF